jgi:hypothetical protein
MVSSAHYVNTERIPAIRLSEWRAAVEIRAAKMPMVNTKQPKKRSPKNQ